VHILAFHDISTMQAKMPHHHHQTPWTVWHEYSSLIALDPFELVPMGEFERLAVPFWRGMERGAESIGVLLVSFCALVVVLCSWSAILVDGPIEMRWLC
jgi:hypothetical protein